MELGRNKAYRAVISRLLALNDRIKGVAFPAMSRTKQITVYHCGPAVLTMLYSFLGVKVSQRGLVASLRAQNKIKKFGFNMKDIARAANIAGKGSFVFWKKANTKISDLDLIINKYKSPVAVEWQGVFYEYSDGDDGHFSIVTEINKKGGYVRVADPYTKFFGTDRKFKIKEFEQRWWDSNEIKVAGTTKLRTVVDNRVSFLIAPKGENWPKKLGMTK